MIALMALTVAGVLCSYANSNVRLADGGPNYGRGSDPIWLDDAIGSDGEASLFDCNHPGWRKHNCVHGDVYEICAIN